MPSETESLAVQLVRALFDATGADLAHPLNVGDTQARHWLPHDISSSDAMALKGHSARIHWLQHGV